MIQTFRPVNSLNKIQVLMTNYTLNIPYGDNGLSIPEFHKKINQHKKKIFNFERKRNTNFRILSTLIFGRETGYSNTAYFIVKFYREEFNDEYVRRQHKLVSAERLKLKRREYAKKAAITRKRKKDEEEMKVYLKLQKKFG